MPIIAEMKHLFVCVESHIVNNNIYRLEKRDLTLNGSLLDKVAEGYLKPVGFKVGIYNDKHYIAYFDVSGSPFIIRCPEDDLTIETKNLKAIDFGKKQAIWVIDNDDGIFHSVHYGIPHIEMTEAPTTEHNGIMGIESPIIWSEYIETDGLGSYLFLQTRDTYHTFDNCGEFTTHQITPDIIDIIVSPTGMIAEVRENTIYIPKRFAIYDTPNIAAATYAKDAIYWVDKENQFYRLKDSKSMSIGKLYCNTVVGLSMEGKYLKVHTLNGEAYYDI